MLGCLTLLVIFGGGFYLMRNAPKLVNYYLSLVEREIERTAEAAVTTEQKAAFKRELQRLRTNLQGGESSINQAQSVLLEINRAVRDQKLTVDEVETLTRRLSETNDRLENKVPGSRFSVLGSQFSVLGSQFSVLGSRFSVLSSQFSDSCFRLR